MQRFRFTLLAICLLLAYLGWTDLSLFLRNRVPANVSIEALASGKIPREWLHVTGGFQDLDEAISTSGSVEIEAFLVPLKATPEERPFHVIVETRNPEILSLLTTYHLTLDSPAAQAAFKKDHAGEFQGRRDVTGLIATGLVANGNRDKLLQLTRQVGMDVAPDVIFLSEGKTPPTWRGFLFLALALAGVAKFVQLGRKPKPSSGPEA